MRQACANCRHWSMVSYNPETRTSECRDPALLRKGLRLVTSQTDGEDCTVHDPGFMARDANYVHSDQRRRLAAERQLIARVLGLA